MKVRFIRGAPLAELMQYSRGEEIANSIIHGLGAVFSVVGLTVLLMLAWIYGTNAHFVSYLIYGSSLIFLYLCSTLYHALPFLAAKSVFKTLDHVGIYLLIAGTYTPFLVLNLAGTWALAMLITIWSLAVVGIILKLFFIGRFRLVSTLAYIAMGSIIMIAYRPMTSALAPDTMRWILMGGLFYIGGTIAYLMKKVRYHHAAWHTSVLMGSIFHYIAIVSQLK